MTGKDCSSPLIAIHYRLSAQIAIILGLDRVYCEGAAHSLRMKSMGFESLWGGSNALINYINPFIGQRKGSRRTSDVSVVDGSLVQVTL